jgi:very-long-chain enoyl-CoA reductase
MSEALAKETLGEASPWLSGLFYGPQLDKTANMWVAVYPPLISTIDFQIPIAIPSRTVPPPYPLSPPLSPVRSIFAALFIMLFANYINEAVGKTTAYSKFAKEETNMGKISSRLGMLFIYTPAFLGSTTFAFLRSAEGGRPFIFSVLMMLQFGKRVLEVLFLHKYSGHTDLKTALPGGAMYLFYSSTCSAYAATLPEYVDTAASSLGLLAFFVGLAGNFYHHHLLANLRPSTPASATAPKKYVVPMGGLFPYVSCPHYFFEVLGWIGVGMFSQHIIPTMVGMAMTSYLAGRAQATTGWYHRKLRAEYPKERGHMIPFIF